LVKDSYINRACIQHSFSFRGTPWAYNEAHWPPTTWLCNPTRDKTLVSVNSETVRSNVVNNLPRSVVVTRCRHRSGCSCYDRATFLSGNLLRKHSSERRAADSPIDRVQSVCPTGTSYLPPAILSGTYPTVQRYISYTFSQGHYSYSSCAQTSLIASVVVKLSLM